MNWQDAAQSDHRQDGSKWLLLADGPCSMPCFQMPSEKAYPFRGAFWSEKFSPRLPTQPSKSDHSRLGRVADPKGMSAQCASSGLAFLL